MIFTILFTLSVTFAQGVYKKYNFDRALAYTLIISYGVFFVVATIIAIYQAVEDTD